MNQIVLTTQYYFMVLDLLVGTNVQFLFLCNIRLQKLYTVFQLLLIGFLASCPLYCTIGITKGKAIVCWSYFFISSLRNLGLFCLKQNLNLQLSPEFWKTSEFSDDYIAITLLVSQLLPITRKIYVPQAEKLDTKSLTHLTEFLSVWDFNPWSFHFLSADPIPLDNFFNYYYFSWIFMLFLKGV